MKKEVIEIQSIDQVLSHLDPETHIFWDIDNTLLMPIHDFGSEHWEKHLTHHFIEAGVKEKEAIQRASHLWRAIQSVSDIKWVEETTAHIFQKAKEKGNPHFGITARSLDFREVTIQQFQTLGIHFPDHKPLYSLQDPTHFSHGIFFCGDSPKAEALQSYLKIHPCRRILMIDDNRHHLETAAQFLPIPFTGLRYGYLDAHRQKYLPDPISKLLFKAFNHPVACKYFINALSE